MPFILVYGFKALLPIDLALYTSSDILSKHFAHKVTELVKQACERMSKVQYAYKK